MKKQEHPFLAQSRLVMDREYSLYLCLLRVPRIRGIWKLGERISSGENADVYEATDRYDDQYVAKIERGSQQYMVQEAEVYNAMLGREGFARFYFFGKHLGLRVLVLQRLWMDFTGLLHFLGNAFSTKDVLLSAVQLLSRLEALHDRGYVHGVLHPGNIMVGSPYSDQDHTIFLINFGNAHKYIDDRMTHVPPQHIGGVVGTLTFGSASMLEGNLQSRRDDLESLAYILVYLYRGELPWTPYCHTRELNRVISMKRELSPADVCLGMPLSLTRFLRVVRAMTFSEQPNYARLRSIFKESLRRRDICPCSDFDWEVFSESD